MKKQIQVFITILSLCLVLATGCKKNNNPEQVTPTPEGNQTVENVQPEENTPSTENTDPEQVTDPTAEEKPDESQPEGDADTPLSPDGNDYYGDFRTEGGTIAYITGVSALEDGTYNSTVFAGIETYAQGAGVSYSYCITDSNEAADCRTAIDTAIKNGSHLIVTSGVHFNEVIGEYERTYPEISFLMIDGVPSDAEGNPIEITPNVHCISFDEQQAGYLAGYITAMDGYTKFGYIGGEAVAPVIRYGHGFVQGIQDAAEELGTTKDISINYWYSDSFLPNDDIYKMSCDWYSDDTEVIFACGGDLYESVLKAADDKDGKIIGVDVNQNPVSERFVTSAMKGLNKAVIVALDDYFAYGGWSDDLAGKEINYGIDDKCPSLPVEDWRFENVTVSDYATLYTNIRNGSVQIDEYISDMSKLPIKVKEY